MDDDTSEIVQLMDTQTWKLWQDLSCLQRQTKASNLYFKIIMNIFTQKMVI